MNTTNHTTRQEYAATYLGKGWSPIPIPRGEKNPGFNDWTKLRVTLEDIPKSPPAGFKGEGNIGLRLGTASGELSDVDLDAPEALAVADIFLPGTPMVAGRKTKPRSHRFYISSTPLLTKPFRDPLIKDPKQAMLLELRANAATGNPHQTVVPPSLHKATGELVSWDGPLDPALVDAQELMTSVTHAAVCSLVARYWKAKLYPHGHDLGMALPALCCASRR